MTERIEKVKGQAQCRNKVRNLKRLLQFAHGGWGKRIGKLSTEEFDSLYNSVHSVRKEVGDCEKTLRR